VNTDCIQATILLFITQEGPKTVL